MKLTDRDVEILRFINDCGYCSTNHLMSYLSVKQWRIYQIMKRLVDRKLVVKEHIFQGHPLIYYLTAEGASFTDLPPIDFVSVGVYRHQMAMVDVVLKLKQVHADAVWVSERHLKHDKYSGGIGKRGHVSDGLLIYPDGRQIAIEVELSVKGKQRIDGILKAYASQLEIKEIWYFCNQSAYTALMPLVAKKSYIKLFSIKEFLA